MAALKLKDRRIVLLLQGGGALGAYQVGAFRALSEHCAVDWVAGISIGAINASVIAGHSGPDAVTELISLWNEILSPSCPPWDCTGLFDAWRPWLSQTWLEPLQAKYSAFAWSAFVSGQPNFFSSRVLNPLKNPWLLQWFGPLDRDQLAFYDTEPLRHTLNKHVNWDLLQPGGPVRLSLGAARVYDGEMEFFDSSKCQLMADHVMASGALPPSFSSVQIGRNWYFDGGLSSNTPIEALHHEFTRGETNDTLVFMVDLWDRKQDTMPQTMDELVWRQKSIQFGSRKKAAEHVVRSHQYQAKLKEIPQTRLEVCEVMLETDVHDPQFCFSDADFRHCSFERLSNQGYDDMHAAIESPEPVPHLDKEFATLYRYGSMHKHRVTDELILA